MLLVSSQDAFCWMTFDLRSQGPDAKAKGYGVPGVTNGGTLVKFAVYIIMVQWKITQKMERKLILEIHPFSTNHDYGFGRVGHLYGCFQK